MDRRITMIAAVSAAALLIAGIAGIVLLQLPTDDAGDDGKDGGENTTTPSPGTSDIDGGATTTPAGRNDSGTPDNSGQRIDNTAPTPTPPPTVTPVPDPTKDEPFVTTSWSSSFPFGGYVGHPAPVYGDPTSGLLYTSVKEQADAAHIGMMVYFVGLTNEEVYVNSTTASGEPQWTNLYNDGGGCYGMLMDDPAAINGGMGWTWMYSGSSAEERHDIAVTVTVYKLGTFEVRTYAYDQDTGKKISDTVTSSFTVVGSGGKYYDGAYLFDSALDGGVSSFVPGEKYEFNFTDTSRVARYTGTVRSVFACPYAEAAWIANDDGSLTPLERNEDGAFTWTWPHGGGIGSHNARLVVQLGIESGGPYSYSSGDYYLVDDATGSLMSHVNGDSHPGVQVYLQSP